MNADLGSNLLDRAMVSADQRVPPPSTDVGPDRLDGRPDAVAEAGIAAIAIPASKAKMKMPGRNLLVLLELVNSRTPASIDCLGFVTHAERILKPKAAATF
jgi:hypothetical protein